MRPWRGTQGGTGIPESIEDMPGKSLNEWNCTQEGDFSLADELTGEQRRESLQIKSEKRKHEGTFSKLENVNNNQ